MSSKNSRISYHLLQFALLIVGLTLFCHCQEETKCAGHDVNLSDVQRAQISQCLDEAGIKTIWKIPATKLSCFGVCILEKKDLLTPDGKINHQKALAYIDSVFPPEVKKPLIDGIDKCIKEHGDVIKSDKSDPNCSTFLDVGQCVHDVFFDVCL